MITFAIDFYIDSFFILCTLEIIIGVALIINYRIRLISKILLSLSNFLAKNDSLSINCLAINLFKQNFEENVWVDKGMDITQANKIKTSILSSARNLKIASEL